MFLSINVADFRPAIFSWKPFKMPLYSNKDCGVNIFQLVCIYNALKMRTARQIKFAHKRCKYEPNSVLLFLPYLGICVSIDMTRKFLNGFLLAVSLNTAKRLPFRSFF